MTSDLDDLQIVVEVLHSTAMECFACHTFAGATLLSMACSPDVLAVGIGKEDVGAVIYISRKSGFLVHGQTLEPVVDAFELLLYCPPTVTSKSDRITFESR